MSEWLQDSHFSLLVVLAVKVSQWPRLSDSGHEARRLKQERDAAVRCSIHGSFMACSTQLFLNQHAKGFSKWQRHATRS